MSRIERLHVDAVINVVATWIGRLVADDVLTPNIARNAATDGVEFVEIPRKVGSPARVSADRLQRPNSG